ncbi:MAG: site-specific integrase [Pseudomonadota bacterium]
MATFRKRGRGWRAEVCRNGVRRSATFATKAEAAAWAASAEAEILAGKRGRIPDKTLGDLLARYRDEVSSGKRSARHEIVRINSILRGGARGASRAPDPIASVRLDELGASHFATWRDRRLKAVSAATVLREWSIMSAAINTAVNEWGWLPANPMRTVKRPPSAKPRERRISDDEIERLLFALGYERGRPPLTKSARVGAAFLFALETAMRAGEIVGLRWEDVHFDKRFLKVAGREPGAGKTPAARREVPLSSEALRILRQLEEVKAGGEPVFRLASTRAINWFFYSAKKRAVIHDLHFHDTRHEAITRLAKRIGVLDLARMVGHRDLRQLMVYYNETASEIAARLD